MLRVEADSLRKAMRAMEARLAEYQAKDTEVCVLTPCPAAVEAKCVEGEGGARECVWQG